MENFGVALRQLFNSYEWSEFNNFKFWFFIFWLLLPKPDMHDTIKSVTNQMNIIKNIWVEHVTYAVAEQLSEILEAIPI